jgi:hypothetical protein
MLDTGVALSAVSSDGKVKVKFSDGVVQTIPVEWATAVWVQLLPLRFQTECNVAQPRCHVAAHPPTIALESGV